MTTRTIWGLLICLVLAAPAAGDVVMMKDGTIQRGETTVQGNKLMIKKGLATVSVDMDQVEKIIKSSAAPEVKPTPATSAPAVSLETARPTGPDSYTRPESHVFLEMRQLATMQAGQASYEISQRIKAWQEKAHDNQRRVGPRWLSPKDCERQRDEFKEKLAKTSDLIAKIRRAGSTTSAGRAEQAKLRRGLSDYFRQAAAVWPDQLMAEFLEGLAYLETQNSALALQSFKQCAAIAPRVAAFRQGQAIALGLRDERLEALAAALEALQLQPDSKDALDLVNETMMSTPGKLMLEPGYVLAKSVVEQYEAPPKTSLVKTGINWMMPGRPWVSRESVLPTPPYDRLAFRQAVGIPIGPNSLLVDHAAMKDALEVFVALDGKTLVPCHPLPGGSGITPKGKEPPPVDLIVVEDLTFTPLNTEAGPAAGGGKGVQVTGATVGLFEEMGSELRPLAGTLEAGAGEGQAKLSVRLAAGEVTSPVISKDGRLIGFLDGRTNAMADGGGPEKFVPVAVADTLIKRGARPGTSSGGYARVKRKAVAKPAPGQFFLMYITAADGLPGKK